MKICVVGKGGREHALVRSLRESASDPEVFCYPGSEAIFELEMCDDVIVDYGNHPVQTLGVDDPAQTQDYDGGKDPEYMENSAWYLSPNVTHHAQSRWS